MNDEESLKVAINAFVWTHAPNNMLLIDAESLATKIFILFLEARNHFTNQVMPSWPGENGTTEKRDA